MTIRLLLKILPAFALSGFVLVAACSTTHQDDTIDLMPQLDASLINYRSQDFAVKEQYPLDTTMVAGELGSYTAVISPVSAVHAHDVPLRR